MPQACGGRIHLFTTFQAGPAWRLDEGLFLHVERYKTELVCLVHEAVVGSGGVLALITSCKAFCSIET